MVAKDPATLNYTITQESTNFQWPRPSDFRRIFFLCLFWLRSFIFGNQERGNTKHFGYFINQKRLQLLSDFAARNQFKNEMQCNYWDNCYLTCNKEFWLWRKKRKRDFYLRSTYACRNTLWGWRNQFRWLIIRNIYLWHYISGKKLPWW